MTTELGAAELQIAAGAPFFHGTYRAPVVIVGGVKASTATPGGSALTGLSWFFASHAPALAYCVCDYTQDAPAVIEYAAARALRLCDFRGRRPPLFVEGGIAWSDRLRDAGFDGVVIDSTTSARDYEYGFLPPAPLAFVRSWSPGRHELAKDWAWDRYCELDNPKTDALHAEWDRHLEAIERRTREALAALRPNGGG